MANNRRLHMFRLQMAADEPRFCQKQHKKAGRHGPAFRENCLGSENRNSRSDRHALIQVFDVIVDHPDAAV